MGSVEQFLQSVIGVILCCLGFITWLIARYIKEMSANRRALWICIGNLFLMQGLYRTVKGGLLNLGTGSLFWLSVGCFVSVVMILVVATREQKGSEIVEREAAKVPFA